MTLTPLMFPLKPSPSPGKRRRERRSLRSGRGGGKSLAQWNRLLEDRRSEASSLDRELSKVEVRAWRALDRWKLITHVRDVFGELGDEESELEKLEDARKNLARERDAAAEQEPDAPGRLVAGVSAVLLAVSGGAPHQWHLTSDSV